MAMRMQLRGTRNHGCFQEYILRDSGRDHSACTCAVKGRVRWVLSVTEQAEKREAIFEGNTVEGKV
jgi:hypothetical protein